MRENENLMLRQYAKQLRSTMTEAEQNLWYHLRRRRLGGVKFLRQKIIGKYIVDFISFDIALIIELDGAQHSDENQRQYDQVRTNYLEARGFKVIRFWNDEILKDIEAVLDIIWHFVDG
ncbi:endonuclease domain-containing protein [Testudinibacter sp. P80/BLE/0925]|uniref:endonuclease domain-containing protein n=1 Tax=Testudinibacter sp. TW-1 TaxID=3417757 RepID=UPI003D36B3E7